MNYHATMALNEPVQGRPANPKMVTFRNGTRSLMPRRNPVQNESRPNPQKTGGSIFAKIKSAFSSRSNANLGQTKLHQVNPSQASSAGRHPSQPDVQILTNEPPRARGQGAGRVMSPREEALHKQLIENHKDHTVEWQPVFHETCTIKLPVAESEKKIAVPQDAIDEWMQDNSRVNQRSKNSIFSNRKSPEQEQEQEQEGSQNNCSFDTGLTHSSCMGAKKEEPYSKFKCYYNYYLVDEYLDALAEMEARKKDNPDPAKEDEENLYDEVNLNVKPILSTKERLESGVPYDPKGLLN